MSQDPDLYLLVFGLVGVNLAVGAIVALVLLTCLDARSWRRYQRERLDQLLGDSHVDLLSFTVRQILRREREHYRIGHDLPP